MRICDLHIEDFGRFTDWHCGPFERRVTLFRGENEAGKSTLLEFIRRLLFGFPDGRSSSNPYPPLAGGNHGGRLTLVDEAGEAVIVQRFRGVRGRQPTLSTPNGEELPDSELKRLLGHHSRAVFQSIFAFTLDELEDAASLKDKHVNSQIYSAGMVGATNLPKALKTLDDQKRALFLAGGTNNELHQAAQKLISVDAGLSKVVENAQNYRYLSGELGNIKAQLKELNERDGNKSSQIAQQNLLENAWPSWNSLGEAEQELSLIPAIDNFPANGVSRLDVLEDQIRTAQQECDSSEYEVEIAKTQKEIIIEHESILDHADEIGGLEQGRTSFTNNIRDLPMRQSELKQQENALMETLRELGADWNEKRLENFDLSLVVREKISQQAKALQEADRRLERRQSTLDQDQRLLQEALGAQQVAQISLDTAPSPEINQEQIGQRRTALRQMQSWLIEIRSIEAQISNLQAQLDGIEGSATPNEGRKGSLAFSTAGFFVGLAILVGGTTLHDRAFFMVMVAGVALISMAAYLFASRKSLVRQHMKSPLADPLQESLHQAKANLEKLRSALAQKAQPFHMDAIDDASLNAAREVLDEAEIQLEERASRTKTLGQAKQLTQRRQSQKQQSKQAVKQAEEGQQRSETEWRTWLAENHLPEDVSPATLGELRGKVDLGKAHLRTLQSTRENIGAMKCSIDEYVAATKRLAVNFGLTIDRDDSHTAATAVRRLAELRIKVEKQVGERQSATQRLRDARRQLQRRKRSLKNMKQEKQALLQLGGTNDAENFRQRAEQYRSRLELEQRKNEAMSRLQRLSGPGQPLEDLKQRLAETDMQTIQERKSRLDQEREKIGEQIKGLSEQRGSTQEKRNQLIDEEESSKLRAERHRLLEDMGGHARAWAVRTVAENLLKEAQTKFEQERQPGVLRDAQEFFRNITGGRYKRVFSPLDQQEIQVTDSDGKKLPNQLSRGTQIGRAHV